MALINQWLAMCITILLHKRDTICRRLELTCDRTMNGSFIVSCVWKLSHVPKKKCVFFGVLPFINCIFIIRQTVERSACCARHKTAETLYCCRSEDFGEAHCVRRPDIWGPRPYLRVNTASIKYNVPHCSVCGHMRLFSQAILLQKKKQRYPCFQLSTCFITLRPDVVLWYLFSAIHQWRQWERADRSTNALSHFWCYRQRLFKE